MKTNKKGFTLVELLVVIAILAILATVAVAGYSSFIESAKESNDETLVAQMNKILEANEAVDGNNASIVEAMNDVLNEGITFDQFTLSASGHIVVWDKTTDRFVIVDSDKADGYETIEGATTKVEKDETKSENWTITDDAIVDLNGKTITLADDKQLLVNANVIITDSTNGGKIEAAKMSNGSAIVVGKNGNLVVNGGSISGVTDYATAEKYYATIGVKDGGTLVVNGGTVEAKKGSSAASGFAIIVYGEGTKCYINGGTFKAEENAALGGNGNDGNGGTYIEINGGTFESEDGAIFHPQAGTMIINGGEFTGKTALYIKAGYVEINGGTFTATSEHKNYKYGGGSFNCTGDAIVVDSCNYPGGVPTVKISGATLKCESNCKEVGVYHCGDANAANVTLNGEAVASTHTEK